MSRAMLWLVSLIAIMGFLCVSAAQAFPQYGEWMSKSAGFETDCLYCHLNRSGPQGKDVGQVGSFSEDQIAKMHTADSPILNDFGNKLMKHLGYQRLLSGLGDPASIARDMDDTDMDGDGVSDGEEMRFGTLPNNPYSAPPQLIWKVRLLKYRELILSVGILGILSCAGFLLLARERSARTG